MIIHPIGCLALIYVYALYEDMVFLTKIPAELIELVGNFPKLRPNACMDYALQASLWFTVRFRYNTLSSY
jgi:hypothetical protein